MRMSLINSTGSYQLNSSSVVDVDPGNSTEVLGSRRPTKLFLAFSIVQIAVGLVATLANLLVHCMLRQKKKKIASEYIVLATLFIDGTFGFSILVVSLLNLLKFSAGIEVRSKVAHCLIQYVPHSFLIFASLFLVLLIQVNRVVAVKNITFYKIAFKSRRVKQYLSALFITSGIIAVMEAGVCVGDPHKQSLFFHIYYHAWMIAKFTLTVLVIITMLITYKLISHQFNRSFWTPLREPFVNFVNRIVSTSDTSSPEVVESPETVATPVRSLRLRLRSVLHRSKGDAPANPKEASPPSQKMSESPRHSEEQEVVVQQKDDPITRLTELQPAPDDHQSQHEEIDDPKSDIELAEMHTQGRINGGLENMVQIGELEGIRPKRVSICSPPDHNDIPEITDGKESAAKSRRTQSYRREESSLYEPSSSNSRNPNESVTLSHHRASGAVAVSTRRRVTIQQQKHHVTTVLFFVSFLFIVVSTPICVFQFYSLIRPLSSGQSWIMGFIWALTETFYGLTFILNPYIFSFNNSFFREKLDELKGKVRLCFSEKFGCVCVEEMVVLDNQASQNADAQC